MPKYRTCMRCVQFVKARYASYTGQTFPETRFSTDARAMDIHSFGRIRNPLISLITRVRRMTIKPGISRGLLFQNQVIVADRRFRFLEIGASRGNFSKLIETRCHADVVALEMDERAASHAKNQLGLNVFSGLFEEFQSDKPFDVIFSGHVIEHVFDPFAFLLKCRDLLAEDGILIFLSPNADSWKQSFMKNDWGWAAKDCHVQFFSVKSAIRALEKIDMKQPR